MRRAARAMYHNRLEFELSADPSTRMTSANSSHLADSSLSVLGSVADIVMRAASARDLKLAT